MEHFDKVIGVELNTGSQIRYHVAVVERKKDVVSVIAHKINCSSLEEIKELLDPQLPIILSVDGKGVLHKLISGATTNRAQQLNQVLPNAAVTDFHLQITPTKQGPLASIIRLDQLKQVLQPFQALSLNVVTIWLGPFHVRYLGNIAGFTSFPTNTGTLEFANTQIESWNPPTEAVQADFLLGDQSLPGNSAVAVSSGLLPLLLEGLSSTQQPAIITESKEAYLHQRLFKKLGMGILFALLGILLINFLAFQHYFTANSELEAQLFVQRAQLTELDTLKSQFKRQQQLFSQYNLNRSSRVSYYADRLATTVPSNIQLEELIINPPADTRPGQTTKLYIFKGEQITVSGAAKDCLAVNKWSGKLKTLDWVQEARIVRCGVGDDGKLSFLIDIKQ